MSVSKEDIEKFKEIGRRLEEEKMNEKKKNPKIAELEAKQAQLRKDADAAAKQLQFLSTTDLEEVQNHQLRENIIKMLKELEVLDEVVEKHTTKLEGAWMPPSLTEQKRFATELNDVANNLFGQFCVLGNQQNWANSEYGGYLPAASKKLEVKAIARTKRLREDACLCNTPDQYGRQCTSRCPCKKAGRPCTGACRCLTAACLNCEVDYHTSQFKVPSKNCFSFVFLF
jgi:hypothetical protein